MVLILLTALSNLATWFVGMITHGDEEMTEVLEEWENVDELSPSSILTRSSTSNSSLTTLILKGSSLRRRKPSPQRNLSAT